MRWAVLLLALLILPCQGGVIAVGTETLPQPAYPFEALQHHHDGVVLVRVTFGTDGKVDRCEVVRSTASHSLDVFTCSFIKQNWRSAKLAGQSGDVPIDYLLDGGKNEWEIDFPAPPFIMPGSPIHDHATYRVTFDAHGFVTKSNVVESSGVPHLDALAMSWMHDRWHHDAYAGQTVNLTIKINKRVGRYILVHR